MSRLASLFLSTILAVSFAMAQNAATPLEQRSLEVIDLNAQVPLDGLALQLASKRVVFVGENHDRYDHHLNQLEIIKRLHAIHPSLAIGVEYFQQPYQAQVDNYIAGRIPEKEFLRAAQYYQGWGYDYRLYAPIFRFARDQHIPVRALNVPTDLPSAVAKVGLKGLSDSQRMYLPKEIIPAGELYRNRLRQVFEGHKTADPSAFDRFVEAQLVWDEGMAESAAAYLNANPERPMIILAGSGHIEFGDGIPARLERRTRATIATVLNEGGEIAPHMADYLVITAKQDLPQAGVLGIALADINNQCQVKTVKKASAGEKAGLRTGDAIVEINGEVIKSVADLHVSLWDKTPGEKVQIQVRRKTHMGGLRLLKFDIVLSS